MFRTTRVWDQFTEAVVPPCVVTLTVRAVVPVPDRSARTLVAVSVVAATTSIYLGMVKVLLRYGDTFD
jgi:hypothetical protein